jgi:hypothetical protein
MPLAPEAPLHALELLVYACRSPQAPQHHACRLDQATAEQPARTLRQPDHPQAERHGRNGTQAKHPPLRVTESRGIVRQVCGEDAESDRQRVQRNQPTTGVV